VPTSTTLLTHFLAQGCLHFKGATLAQGC